MDHSITGCSAAWSARSVRDAEAAGSNPANPTMTMMGVSELRSKAAWIAIELGIPPQTWNKFINKLHVLQVHSFDSYKHCLRVGIYSHGLASLEGSPIPKLAFFGGCGHDLGKCEIATDVLNSRVWTPECQKAIEAHVTEGFEHWKGEFLFTGFIAGLHHRFQPHGYGIDVRACSPIPLTDEQIETLHETARLVMVADFFDAITTRHNDRGLVDDPSDMTEVSNTMKNFFPQYEERIDWLVSHPLQRAVAQFG